MKTDLLSRISQGKTLVADGATGTVYFSHGLEPGACPEEWNLSRPEIVGQIAENYARAGSDIVHTNTFGGSATKLNEYGLAEKCREINQLGVDIIRKRLGKDVLISGSVGPSGKLLAPYGDVSQDELEAGFKTQIEALISSGVDLLNIETMTSLEEGMIALNIAKGTDARIPVCISFTFNESPKGFNTFMGDGVAEIVQQSTQAGADIIGSNCGNGFETMIAIAEELRKQTTLPLLVQSNAGVPELIDGRLHYNESPEYFAERIHRLLDLNISIIGGCCGTTHEHIAAIRNVIP